MAGKRHLAELIIRLREQGADKVAKSLKDIDKNLNALGKDAGKNGQALGVLADQLKKVEQAAKGGLADKWGTSFQKQIDRLKLSAGELEKIRESFRRLQAELKEAGDVSRAPGFTRAAMARWRSAALAEIVQVRAAQDALTREAILAARQRAAAEKKAAAEAAKAQKDAAREILAQKRQAAREAAREARAAALEEVQAARTAAREKIKAAREAARAAREANRELLKAQRDDARSVGNLGRVARGTIAGTVGMGVGAYGAGTVARRGVTAAAEYQRQNARDYLAGIDGLSPDLAAASLRASGKYTSVDAATLRESLRDAGLAMGDIKKSIGLANEFGQALTVMQSLKGKEQAVSEFRGFMRALDNLDRVQDPGRVRDILAGFVKASGVEGQELNLRDLFTFAKRAKSGGASLSDEFLYTVGPNLITDMGADRAGTSIGSMVSNIVGGTRLPAEKARNQVRFGIRNKAGKVNDSDLLLSNPYLWSEKILLPELRRRGVGLEDNAAITAEMAQLFPNQLVADLFTRLLTQRDQIEKKQSQYRAAPGLTAAESLAGKDPFVAAEGLLASVRNLSAIALDPAMPAAAAALDGLSHSLGQLTSRIAEAQKADPRFAALLSAGTVAAGAVTAGALGKYALDVAAGTGNGVTNNVARWGSRALGAAGRVAGRAVPFVGAGVMAKDVYDFATDPEQRARELGGSRISDLTRRGLGPALGRDMTGVNAGTEAARDVVEEMRAKAKAAANMPDVGAQAAQSIAAGMAQNAGAVDAQAQGIWARIRSLFGQGVDVPVRLQGPTGAAGAAPSAPGRASGGSVLAGQLYKVGEHGEEYYAPSANGAIYTPAQLARAGQGGRASRSGTVSMTNHFHISGADDPDTIVETVMRRIDEKLESGFDGLFEDGGAEIA